MKSPASLNKVSRLPELLGTAITWLGIAFLVYLLSAPPLMLLALKATGRMPAVYLPVIRIFESDFGTPLLWYFNEIWHMEVMMIGDVDGSWKQGVIFTACVLMAVGAIYAAHLWKKRARLQNA